MGRVIPAGELICRRAGEVLFGVGKDSTHAVDAFVVATAVALGGAVIATGDTDDIRVLSARYPNVSVFGLA